MKSPFDSLRSLRALPALVFVLLASAAFADVTPLPVSPGDFRLSAVLEAGRKKPVDTFAREKLEFMTGKETYKGQDPVATLLSMAFEPEKWADVELFKVSYPQLIESIGKHKDGRLANVYSSHELLSNASLMDEISKREMSSREKRDGPREKALDELRAKLGYFHGLAEGLRVLPPPPGFPKDAWFAFVEASPGAWQASGAPRELYASGWLEETEKLWGDLAGSVRKGDAAGANSAMESLAARLSSVNPDKYPPRSMLVVEHAFMSWKPFVWSWIIYALACAVFGIGIAMSAKPWHRAGFVLMCVGFAAHLTGVGMRAYVAQRAPWADLYEAMVVVTLMCVVFAIVFESLHRTAYVGMSATFMAAAGLVGASMLPFDFRTIDPLVPVLRSWWLKYHVLSMISSYGAFTLAFGVSLIHLWMHFGKKDMAASKKLEDLTYRVVQVGFFFITMGIILGAVWADSAWGRYWGWDPKEIWALVTWFIYGAYIHGRMIGWCRGIRAAAASIFGYAAVLFTFFGVNFVLTGLHSYANPS